MRDCERRIAFDRLAICLGSALELTGAHQRLAMQIRFEGRQRGRRDRRGANETIRRRMSQLAEQLRSQTIHEREDRVRCSADDGSRARVRAADAIDRRLDLESVSCLNHIAEDIHARAETGGNATRGLSGPCDTTGVRHCGEDGPSVHWPQRVSPVERRSKQVDDSVAKWRHTLFAPRGKWKHGDD